MTAYLVLLIPSAIITFFILQWRNLGEYIAKLFITWVAISIIVAIIDSTGLSGRNSSDDLEYSEYELR